VSTRACGTLSVGAACTVRRFATRRSALEPVRSAPGFAPVRVRNARRFAAETILRMRRFAAECVWSVGGFAAVAALSARCASVFALVGT
jgi:hypothetical protein